jgi:hypothetical protein
MERASFQSLVFGFYTLGFSLIAPIVQVRDRQKTPRRLLTCRLKQRSFAKTGSGKT